jgi:hypothetical protein
MEKVILVTVETADDDEDGDTLYGELIGYLERNDAVVAYTIRDGGIG